MFTGIIVISLFSVLFLVGIKLHFRALFLMFFLICFINYFIQILDLPNILYFHKEVLLLSIIGVFIAINRNVFRYNKVLKPLYVITFLFLLILIISTVINHNNLLKLISAIRHYLFFPFLLLFAYPLLKKPEKHIKSLIKIFYFTALIQIPVSIIQWMIFERADYVGGLFDRHASGQISILGISFIFLFYFYDKYVSRHPINKILIIGMVFTLMIAESKLAMYIIPLIILFAAYKYSYSKVKAITLAVIILIPLFIAIMPLFDYLNTSDMHKANYMKIFLDNPIQPIEKRSVDIMNEKYKNIISEEDLYKKGRYFPVFNRISSIPYAFFTINRSTQSLFFGKGPFEASINSLIQGDLAQSGHFRTLFVNLTLEIGVIGTLTYMLFIFYLLKVNNKVLKFIKKVPVNKYWKVLVYFSNIQIVITIIGVFYNLSIIGNVIGIYFWLSNLFIMKFYTKNYQLMEKTKLQNIRKSIKFTLG